MKKYTLIINLFFCIYTFAQKPQHFQFEGKIKQPKSGILYLIGAGSPGYSTKKVFSIYPYDSVNITDGKFSFRGTLNYPQLVMLFSDNNLSDVFFLQSGNQFVEIDSLERNSFLDIKGSDLNKAYLSYTTFMKINSDKLNSWVNKLMVLNTKYDKKIPDSLQILANSEKINILKERDSMFLSYITKRPNSYISLWMLIYRFSKNGYSSFYDKCFNFLSDKLKSTYSGNILSQKLLSAAYTSLDSQFHKIPLIDVYNKKVFQPVINPELNYTLLDFWYSHCAPCIQQFEKLKTIYKKYHSKGFEIIGISTDEKKDKADWKNAITKYNLSWQQFWDINGIWAQKLSINSFPTNFLLDHTGKIIAKNIESTELEKLLENNLR